MNFPVLASTHAFEVGTERIFSIINDVSLYDLKTAESPISYRISGTVKVGAIWSNDDNDEFVLRFEVRLIRSYKIHRMSLIGQQMYFSSNRPNYIFRSSRSTQLTTMRNVRH